ncbi:MAG: cupredoxin domain-containing protein [Candidatus Rokuibacteriota bacterium]
MTAGGVAAVLCLLVLAAWAAFVGLPEGRREAVYVIPKGTARQQALGVKPSVLPDVMRFTLGVRDVLVLRNEDDGAATFGPVLLEPGQTYRVPFRTATTFQLACSVHEGGQVGIVVTPAPREGWDRLQWRVMNLIGR